MDFLSRPSRECIEKGGSVVGKCKHSIKQYLSKLLGLSSGHVPLLALNLDLCSILSSWHHVHYNLIRSHESYISSSISIQLYCIWSQKSTKFPSEESLKGFNCLRPLSHADTERGARNNVFLLLLETFAYSSGNDKFSYLEIFKYTVKNLPQGSILHGNDENQCN